MEKQKIRMIQLIIFSFIFGIIQQEAYSQPDPPNPPDHSTEQATTIKTPTGENMDAILFTDADYWPEYWEEYGVWLINSEDWDATWKAPATHEYNCHGYAWYVSEGGSNVWINDVDSWTESESYVETASPTNGRKVHYTDDNHSAITTTNSNYYKSKWGRLPLYQHLKNHCPYTSTNLEYYKLDPNMTGSTSILCYNVNRPFNTNITDMPGATLTWTKGYYLAYVSGAGTPEYTVKGLVGGGYSYANFQITTPSGFSWSSQKDFFVGTPYVNPASIQFTCVEGPGYFCTNAFGNEYSFYYTGPYNYFDIKLTNLSETQTLTTDRIYNTWSTLEYWPPEGTYKFMVRGNNYCGTATSWSKTTVDYVDCGFGEFLSFVPNPATVEITMELKTDNIDTFTEGDKWEAEIFNRQMLLMHKTTRLKDKTYTINVSGWKEGIYYVRVRVKDKLVSGKFIVTR